MKSDGWNRPTWSQTQDVLELSDDSYSMIEALDWTLMKSQKVDLRYGKEEKQEHSTG